jgi:quinol monooxygenase YgiN
MGNKSHKLRIARIIVDARFLEEYKEMLKESIEAALSAEKGVLALNAVYDKENPAHITVFEAYDNEEAYLFHIETPHFKKYKTTTQDIVQSLELIDVVPL